jgi:hypothetical protein
MQALCVYTPIYIELKNFRFAKFLCLRAMAIVCETSYSDPRISKFSQALCEEPSVCVCVGGGETKNCFSPLFNSFLSLFFFHYILRDLPFDRLLFFSFLFFSFFLFFFFYIEFTQKCFMRYYTTLKYNYNALMLLLTIIS